MAGPHPSRLSGSIRNFAATLLAAARTRLALLANELHAERLRVGRLLVLSVGAGAVLAKDAAAVDFVRDAFGHLKVIGFNGPSASLLDKAGLSGMFDEGVIKVEDTAGIQKYLSIAKQHRIWDREPKLRSPG